MTRFIRRVLCLSMLLCCIVQFCVNASAVVLVEPYYEQIPLRTTDYSDVLTAAKEGTLDSVLYPSGMTLPTKYADLMFFASNYEQSASVPPQIKEFITRNWPTKDGKYTMAEVNAAQMFYYTFCWPLYTDAPDGVVSNTLERMATTSYSEQMFNYDLVTHVAVVLDSTTFVPVLEAMRVPLEAPGKEEGNPMNSSEYWSLISTGNPTGLPLSIGYEFNWLYYMQQGATRGESDTLENIAQFFASRSDYNAYFGIELLPTDVNTMDVDHILAYSGFSSTILTSGKLQFTEVPLFCWDLPSGPDEDTSVYYDKWLNLPRPIAPNPADYIVGNVPSLGGAMAGDAPTETPIDSDYTPPILEDSDSSSQLDNTYGSNYVGAYDNSRVEDLIVPHKVGLRDVLTWLAVFVVISVVSGICVVDYISKRNDPARRWRRR